MATYTSIDVSSPVQIEHWNGLDEALAGSRAKQSFEDPETEQFYIFKEPKRNREAQIWSEVIASFIAGDLLNWPVQFTQIAMNGGRVGNLLKYIFDPKRDQFLAGEQLCKHVDPDFDPIQGKRHTWQLINTIHDEFVGFDPDTGDFRRYVSEDYKRFWVRTIAFDTLISNTDRHAENWALCLVENGPSIMAPFFDNATSMGCEVDVQGLKKWFLPGGEINRTKLESYASRGCHHLRDGSKRYKFEELATVVLKENSTMRSEYEAIANLDIRQLDPVFEDITAMQGLPTQARLTANRREQITQLLHEGQSRVIRTLEESK